MEDRSSQQTSSSPLIDIHGLHKVFKDFWGRPKVAALSGIDLQLQRGEVCALVGPNGSGKTTLVKILLGLLFPSQGSAKIFGEHCYDLRSKSKIGYLAEENCFYPHLTGWETLEFYSKLLNIPKNKRRERMEELLHITDMEAAAHRPIGEYSLGMLRRIGIAQALLADPELIILDEPTNGLDPIGIEEVHQLITQLRDRGKSIFICTHLLAETEDICDNICLLYQGKVLANGSLEDLHQQYQTRRMKDLFLKLVPKRDRPLRKGAFSADEAQSSSQQGNDSSGKEPANHEPKLSQQSQKQTKVSNEEKPTQEKTSSSQQGPLDQNSQAGPDQDYLDQLGK